MQLIYLWMILLISPIASYGDVDMNQSKLEGIVKELSEKENGSGGMVQFNYRGVDMVCISDVNHDRMRIITPIVEYSNLSKAQLDSILESNFHLALDARYAVSDGVLYSAYIHPLASLEKQQIVSAVEQVYNLAVTFGTEYSSGSLSYNVQ